MSDWPRITDLIGNEESAEVALIGAPMEAGSVTPGRCDLAPAAVRKAMKRISTYDLVEALELNDPVHDAGDVAVQGLMPAEGFAPIRDGLAALTARHGLTLLIGGNNAVTRPAAHGLGVSLAEVGLITLDAHFDMRDLHEGLSNGNPVRALIADGLPGANIAQVGLASFANSEIMHRDAVAAGNLVVTIGEVRLNGIERTIERALAHVAHCEAILVDCDIDVIDRSQSPGAPGARPGGMAVTDFFKAVRHLASDPRVRVIDLTEWDPPLDATDLSALTAARWVAECLAGYELR